MVKRVMCINDNWLPCPKTTNQPAPAFGDIDTVADVILDSGYEWYILARFAKNQGFVPKNFIPLNDCDPMEKVTDEKQSA